MRDLLDEHAFPIAREAVVSLFDAWAADRCRPVEPAIVGEALRFKWQRAGGDLRSWQMVDFPSFYDHWLPHGRVDRRTLASLGPTMLAFVDFLSEMGWLEPTAPTRWDVRALVTGLSVRLVDTLTGCVQCELLAERLRSERADIGDPGVQERLLAVMSRHLIEHFPPPPLEPTLLSLLEPHQVAYRPTRWMHPPVSLGPEETLESAAAAAPAVVRLRRFTLWVGPMRQLTTRGYLRVPDALDAAQVLGVYRQDRPDPSRRVATSSRLGQTHFTYTWALSVGLVRVDRGVLTPTLLGAVLLDRPLELVARAFTVLCTRALRAQWSRGASGARLVDTPYDLLHCLIDALYGAEMPVQFSAFLDSTGGFPGQGDAGEPRREGLRHLVVQLEDLGLVRAEGGQVERRPDGSRQRHGGALRLTPLGIWCAHRMLRAEGLPTPVLGELSDFDAATLLEMCAGYDDEAAAAEAERWRLTRGERAGSELAEAIRQGHPGNRMSAFAAMSGLGADAEHAVRSLLDEPRIRPFALMWLIDNGFENHEALAPDDLAHMLVEAMVAFLHDDPDKAVYVFARDRTVEEQIVDIAHVWRLDNPYAVPLLEAIADRHPHGEVAHAARVALHTR